jgi:hypothetical protein
MPEKVKPDVSVGTKFYRFITLSEPFWGIQGSGAPQWLIECECSCKDRNIRIVRWNNIRLGKHKSCGCLRIDSPNSRIHGESEECETRSNLYTVWINMEDRCYNKNHVAYHRYGYRGISVCQDWRYNYLNFRDWAHSHGYQEGSRLQIDRIDNDMSYCPNNCKFSTSLQNGNNKSNNHYLTAFGENRTITQWSRDEKCVVSLSVLKNRIHCGWDAEKALTTPKRIFKTN